MYYVMTDAQETEINNQLSLIGEPPITSEAVVSGIKRVLYADFNVEFRRKFTPYTGQAMQPAIVDLLGDIDPVFMTGDLIAQIFSPSGPHDHDANYSPIAHDHNSQYSELIHQHDTLYSPIGHTHPPGGPHDHDLLYAPISHVDETVIHSDTVLAPYTFTLEGNGSTGMWLTASTRSGIPSNLAPAIAPADVVLIASTYSNENNNSSFSLDFYINGGATPAYTWDIVNARVGRKNHDESLMPPELMLNRDDRLSLRVGALSSLPKDAFVILYFALASDPTPSEFFLATI